MHHPRNRCSGDGCFLGRGNRSASVVAVSVRVLSPVLSSVGRGTQKGTVGALPDNGEERCGGVGRQGTWVRIGGRTARAVRERGLMPLAPRRAFSSGGSVSGPGRLGSGSGVAKVTGNGAGYRPSYPRRHPRRIYRDSTGEVPHLREGFRRIYSDTGFLCGEGFPRRSAFCVEQ